MADEAPLFGNRYRLVRHIARGGMAQVYEARDTLLDRPVALKVLFPELSVDEAFVERFRREARNAANLSHPNIVSVYDWGQGDTTYFIVMEMIDGETLSARIKRRPLVPDQAAVVAIATSSALAFAHRHGVIHRDVKPANVLIDRSGQVKVTDFGIARAIGASENLTQVGSVMGTATYFSPEQAQGLPVDARSDVYSLGVVMYEMVVGSPPFKAETPVAIAYKHVREQPEAPTSRNPAVPANYEAIVLKAMAKDPERRYQSADELRSDLERFRAGRPVRAAMVSPPSTAPDATTVVGAAALGGAAAEATRVATRVAPQRASEPTRAVPATQMQPAATRPGDHDGYGDEGRKRTGLYVLLLVILLAALAVLGYVIGKDNGWFGVKTLTIPNVAGQPVAAAESRLTNAGFTDVTDRKVASAKVAAGDTTGTDPAIGSAVKSDDPIVVLVSSGPLRVKVPTVANLSQAKAVHDLKRAGFKTTVVGGSSMTVPHGEVIKTDPAGGLLAPKGSSVTVTVSSGLPTVKIPSVVGDTPVAAAAKLKSDGFVPIQGQQASSTVAAGMVSGTNPPAGTGVSAGSQVTVYVSTGPATLLVPDVIGDSPPDAELALSEQGFRAAIQTVPVSSSGQNNKVISTNPPASTQQPVGSTVTLYVGSYTAPTTPSTVPPTSTTTSPPPSSSSTSTPSPPSTGS